MVTVVFMPIGFRAPSRRPTRTIRASVATAAVAALTLGTGGAAHADAALDDSALDYSTVNYPAPGQPLAGPSNDDVPAGQESIQSEGPGGDADERTSSDRESDRSAIHEAAVEKADGALRVATLHAELTADANFADPVQQLIGSLSSGSYAPARAVAKTAQAADPDVLVLTGVTFDAQEQIAQNLRERYLAVGQDGLSGIDYPYIFTAETNSGEESGVDLDGDGMIGGPHDVIGAGEFPGQHGMVVFSKHPIADSEVRTFQDFRWDRLPDNSMPERFSALERSTLRLQETSFWDVPVAVGDNEDHIHVLATAVALDSESAIDPGRTADIRRVVADYAAGEAWYLTDDDGGTGALHPSEPFVITGIPAAVDDSQDGVEQLSTAYAIKDPEPSATSEAVDSTLKDADAAATLTEDGEPVARTSVVLPSSALTVEGSGVFWPAEGEVGYDVVDPASSLGLSSRLVWADLSLTGENP